MAPSHRSSGPPKEHLKKPNPAFTSLHHQKYRTVPYLLGHYDATKSPPPHIHLLLISSTRHNTTTNFLTGPVHSHVDNIHPHSHKSVVLRHPSETLAHPLTLTHHHLFALWIEGISILSGTTPSDFPPPLLSTSDLGLIYRPGEELQTTCLP